MQLALTSFDPTHVHCTMHAHTHIVHVPVQYSVHRAQRAVAGPTNKNTSFVFECGILALMIRLKFWHVQKDQGATNSHGMQAWNFSADQLISSFFKSILVP